MKTRTELTPNKWLDYYKKILEESHQTFRPTGFEIIAKIIEDYDFIKHYMIGLKNGDFIIVGKYDEIEKDKRVKAIDILKNRDIDLDELKFSKHYEQYCTLIDMSDYPVSRENMPTKAEYDLLKEVLL